MNIYALIIITTILGSFVLATVAELLNLKALKPNLPAEFEGTYDSADYKKSQEYTKTTTKFGFLVSTFDLVVLLAFWFSGSFNRVDQLVGSLVDGPILTGLAYIAVLLVMKFVISLPFSIYSTFVIEERFGFNRTSPGTFIMDILKGLLLTVVLGGGIMTCVLAIFQLGGSNAWLYCWAAVTVLSMILQFIAPTWIMPLFNKFKPLEEGELKESIISYAKSVNFSLENVFVMDGSKRSSKSNAFFTGFGKHKRIALFDTLIDKHSTDELLAILAHEIGHYKKRHIVQGMCISIVHMGVMFYLLSIFLTHGGLFEAFFMEQASVYAGFIFFGLLFSPIETVLAIFINMLSRANEFEADRFAVQSLKKGDALIEALKKLSVHNLSNLTPHPFYVFLNYSHPPLLQRIKAIAQQK